MYHQDRVRRSCTEDETKHLSVCAQPSVNASLFFHTPTKASLKISVWTRGSSLCVRPDKEADRETRPPSAEHQLVCVRAITPVLLRITQLDLCAKGLWLLQRSVPQHWIITELAECSALPRSQMSTTSVQTGINKKELPQMCDCGRGKGRAGRVKWG